jgi:2-polyprenyl-6-methoxyphenol hydroxylase-like FAD-dependent oxidoreductase
MEDPRAMTAHGEPDVLVVGAGPTGLTLAAQLHALGAGVRIVDRQLDREHESRALAVQPRTLEVLRGLGIAPTLVERGNDTSQLQLHAGERVVVVRLFDVGLEDTAFPFLLFISQAETEAVLNEHLAEQGVDVERGVELVEFKAGEDAVRCTLRHGDETTERLHARYLVGCDGAHSSVRHGAGIPFEGGAYPQTFVLGDLEVDGELEPDVGHAFLGESGMLFFFPLARPASWRMLGMRPPGGEDEQERAQPTLADLQGIAEAFTGGRLRLRDPVWLTYFRLHHRHAARYRADRVFLAGDAAHVHSPAGAQGMNTGIQEASTWAGKSPSSPKASPTRRCSRATRPSGSRSAASYFASPTARPGSQPPSAAPCGCCEQSSCRGWHRSCCDLPGHGRTAFARSRSCVSTTETALQSKRASQP